MRVAAIQVAPRLGDVPANLQACARLVHEAAEHGAELIVLPEFFTTGMAYLPSIGAGAIPSSQLGAWLVEQAGTHDVLVGGSALCRDEDEHVRNAFMLADRDGVLGRHDKDLPTMWENAFYVGGSDDGVIALRDGRQVGVALCWELMRSQTVRRLRGRVDLVIGGSAWWSVPSWPPRAVTRRWEAANARTARRSVRAFAPLIGAPLVHASLCGPLSCPTPGLPLHYRGHYEGPAGVYDARGEAIAERSAAEGTGLVVSDLDPGRRPPAPVGSRFWLHRRGPLPTLAWNWQRELGRHEYARHRTSRST